MEKSPIRHPLMPTHNHASEGNGTTLTQEKILSAISNQLVNPPSFLTGFYNGDYLSHFPTAVRAFMEIGSKSIVCPIEFKMLAVLVCCAVVIGGKHKLKVKSGYTVGANIFACIVGEPGSRKSPAIKLALTPLFRLQKTLRDNAAVLGDEGQLCDTIVTTDATMEALIELLSYTDRVLLLKEEFMGFLNALNKYRPGDDQQKFLSIYAQFFIAEHRKKKAPIKVENPTLSILGGIQVDVLVNLAKLPDDGLVDRILFAYPPAIPAKHSDVEVPSEVLDGYCGIMERIFHNNPDQIQEYPFSSEAQSLYRQWHIEFCRLQNNDSLSPFMKQKLHKLEACTAKFSLILEFMHAAANNNQVTEISEASLRGAIELVNYFGAQLYKVGESFESNMFEKQIKKLFSWLQRQKRGSAELRKILACRVAGVKNKTELEQILLEMRSRNYGFFTPNANEPTGTKVAFCLHRQNWTANTPE